MSSRFNTLYLGEAAEAAQALENTGARSNTDRNVDELRVALINALNKIDRLEQRMALMEDWRRQ